MMLVFLPRREEAVGSNSTPFFFAPFGADQLVGLDDVADLASGCRRRW